MRQFRTRIKVCGITREQDVLSAVAAGVDAIGLVFYPSSKRFVSAPAAKLLVAQLPAFVSAVGLFVDASAKEVNDILSEAPLDLLQFHGQESPDFCRQFGRRYMKAVRVRDTQDIVLAQQDYSDAAALLLDTWVDGVPGGTGLCFDWSMIPAQSQMPLVLAGGLNSANVRQAIASVQPWAVDVSGGVESAPGIKDPDRIMSFVEEVRKAHEID